MGGKVFTEPEFAFRPFTDLPPIRRASLAVALNPNAPEAPPPSCHPHASPAGAPRRDPVAMSAMPVRPGDGSATPIAASSSASSASSTAASVILIGGGRTQLSEPAAARDLYASPLFARRRARAEASGVPWFVVSGRWGLLDPDDFLAPYTFSFAAQPVNYRRAWGRFVAEQLCVVRSVGRGDVVEICAAAGYAAALTAPIQYLGAQVRRADVDASDAGDEPR